MLWNKSIFYIILETIIPTFCQRPHIKWITNATHTNYYLTACNWMRTRGCTPIYLYIYTSSFRYVEIYLYIFIFVKYSKVRFLKISNHVLPHQRHHLLVIFSFLLGQSFARPPLDNLKQSGSLAVAQNNAPWAAQMQNRSQRLAKFSIRRPNRPCEEERQERWRWDWMSVPSCGWGLRYVWIVQIWNSRRP